MNYEDFLVSKRLVVPAAGRDINRDLLHPALFPFQRDLVHWSLRKGRAAIFADCGMGKTIMQLEWARHAAGRTLILAPLAVAQQSVAEGRKWGYTVTYCRSGEDAPREGTVITNYEMMSHFDPSRFEAVVLDESSILKSFEGKMRSALIERFQETPMRLCCTATPAPNDISEIANHAEFLGHMTRAEMLAAFFVHDDAGWRLKGHARTAFYRWLASWGMSVRRPSDINEEYGDAGWNLPSLAIEPQFIEVETPPSDRLFQVGLKGVTERATVRRDTLRERVEAAAALIRTESDVPWLAWVGLNEEGRLLQQEIPTALLVEGSQSPDEKAQHMGDFSAGRARILITKPSVSGHGMNWQHCNRMVFVGLSDSYESYYQCIRRCWRYGQKKPVVVHIVLSDRETDIYANVLSKEAEAKQMAEELVKNVTSFSRDEMTNATARQDYAASQEMILPSWLEAGR